MKEIPKMQEEAYYVIIHRLSDTSSWNAHSKIFDDKEKANEQAAAMKSSYTDEGFSTYDAHVRPVVLPVK